MERDYNNLAGIGEGAVHAAKRFLPSSCQSLACRRHRRELAKMLNEYEARLQMNGSSPQSKRKELAIIWR